MSATQKMELKATSKAAGIEVGARHWSQTWQVSSEKIYMGVMWVGKQGRISKNYFDFEHECLR